MIKAVMFLYGCLLFFTFQNALGAEPRQAPSAQEKARTLYLLNQPEQPVIVTKSNWFTPPANQHVTDRQQ